MQQAVNDVQKQNGNVRMGSCQSCSHAEGKYRCPGCGVVSCSVACVRQHKMTKPCDGVRAHTRFIRINEFKVHDLVNDVHLLQEAQGCVQSAKRDKLKRFTRKGEQAMPLAPHLVKLYKSCLFRRCQIRFLPPHFERHRSNSTRLHFKQNKIYWKLECHFSHANQVVVMDKVDESRFLCNILEPYLTPKSDQLDEDPFQIYRSRHMSRLRLFLQAEGIHRRPRRFYKLNLWRSLAWNLRNKIIVEHPIVFLVFEEHAPFFCNHLNGLDSDSEEDDDRPPPPPGMERPGLCPVQNEVMEATRRDSSEEVCPTVSSLVAYSGSEEED